MYKTLFLAAVVLAQAPMPPVRVTAPPVPPVAPMRLPDPGPNDGITVTGMGSATAPASDARVTLRISTRNNATTLDAKALQPIVDAMVRAGVDRANITLPPYLTGTTHTNGVSITAQVHHPTQDMLERGMAQLAGTFASMPDVLLNGAEVRLTADNCTALQQTAEANAIANARANAAFVAKQIGAKTGGVLAVEQRGMALGAPEACTQTVYVGPFGSPSQVSPADLFTVKIITSVSMRFAIRR